MTLLIVIVLALTAFNVLTLLINAVLITIMMKMYTEIFKEKAFGKRWEGTLGDKAS